MGGGVQGNGEGAGPSAERDGGSSAATSHWPGREPAGAAIGPSQVELSALPPWARVKRVVMHYVRFFRAFSVLRNMHVPLELDTTLLAKKENLGEGCFAICSRIVAIDKMGVKRELAMKLLKHGSGDQDVDDFIREREVLKKLRHSRIVSYFDSGHVHLPGMHFPEMYLAMEFMPGGSIRDMILRQMDSPHRKVYTKVDALRWLLDIARALHYMHSRSPCVVHRDLKPENIMLTSTVASKATAKLTDYGLHCLIAREGTDSDDVYQLTGNTGSLMYMAPEVYAAPGERSKHKYNEKVDIYSLAMVMYEVFKRQPRDLALTDHSETETQAAYAAKGDRPRIPKSWPTPLSDLIQQCWAQEPAQRPPAADIASRLSGMRQQIVESLDMTGLYKWAAD